LAVAEATKITDLIPAELHGCRVTVGVGPYPPDGGHTQQKAMYAELVPITPVAQKRLKSMNRKRILGMVPLTTEGAGLIQADPQGPVAEQAATAALFEASKLAKGLDK
jgi:hypothetical protein